MTRETYEPPPGPPPSWCQRQQSEKYEPPPGPPPGHSTHVTFKSEGGHNSNYAPPPGPPPNRRNPNDTSYAPPPGPPPRHSKSSDAEYAPPSGPPPSHAFSSTTNTYIPPQGPPPSNKMPQQPTLPYHDWTIIPDNSLLPPPPSIGYDSSPTANATLAEGDNAYAWTQAHPLRQPQNLTPAQHAAIQAGQLSFLKPPTYTGDILPQRRPGHWKCRTRPPWVDSSLITSLPLYSVFWDSPLRTHRPKTLYFELHVLGIGRDGSSFTEAGAGIAVGFVAPPYPTFRLPGWQRGSLGVHGDDGRKYVNDTYGGSDFTTAFKPGDTVGIGMIFAPPRNPPLYAAQQDAKLLDIDVFFTRNGKREGGWDGNEELDARSEGGTAGLRGECDLFAAVGVFGGVDFEVFFSPEDWRFNPY